MPDDEQGLYDKFEVYKDGEQIHDCFVLRPKTDNAAWDALVKYADSTPNRQLSNDLYEWLSNIPHTDYDTENDDA